MKLRSKEFIDVFLGNILIALNIVPVRLLGLLMRRDHSLDKAPDAIIITKLLGLGSLLMAGDAITSIREKYPSARLILVCSVSIGTEVKALGLFDDVWELNDSGLFPMTVSFLRILLRSWWLPNKWTVNIEVYSRLTTIFSLWTLARNRFGFYFNEVKFRHSLNTHHIYFNQMALAYDNYEQIANSLGALVSGNYVVPASKLIYITEHKGKFIAINNNCSELAKERLIPDATLVEVIRQLLQFSPDAIALIGSKADHPYNESIRNSKDLSAYADRIVNIAGHYSFTDFLSVLKTGCSLLVTVDSAPVHIAYRLQLPTVSVWGPTHPATRIPAGFAHEMIYLHQHCSPCVHHTDILPCGGNNICMKNITATVIVEAIKKTIHHGVSPE